MLHKTLTTFLVDELRHKIKPEDYDISLDKVRLMLGEFGKISSNRVTRIMTELGFTAIRETLPGQGAGVSRYMRHLQKANK